ncbi:MAG: sigma-70 family RNA polymerase sigma factor [Bacteroidota bacterium]|nr:sigma-70 family RNA polymerase sigma factor [Bacteroidota bacterium]
MTNTSTDQDLITSFRVRKDTDALGTLYLRYTELVYGVCLKYFGQPDLAQDAVMDIYEHINRKLPGHEVDNFPGWLYMVSKNHCLQVLRKKSNSLTVSLDDPVMQNGRDWHQEDEEFELVIHQDSTDQLHGCIEQLPDKQQMCIRLFYFEKKSYAEIVVLVSQPMDTVRSNIQNGKRNLKKCKESKQKHGLQRDI